MNASIDLATLRVVVAAADLGSISAASNHLGLAVAAASSRISLLEEAVGLRIFERSPRGVQLTPAGRMLLERSRSLLADVALAASQLGAVPAYLAAAPLAADLARESANWGQVIREQKISAD